jgi:hypothetical protein
MNPGPILATFAKHEVDCLLIGGMNFFLRHRAVTTFDVDFWVNDEDSNLIKVNAALIELRAEWGATAETFAPVPSDPAWLKRQSVLCLTSPAGAIDIFRSVHGLPNYTICRTRGVTVTRDGTIFPALSDADMLACQLALPEGERRLDRIAYLKNILAP